MTERDEIFAAVKKHLEERGLDGHKITMDAELLRDLDLDSLDTMELTLGMEDRFGIEIPDGDLEHLVTVGDAVGLIEKTRTVNA